MPYLVVVSDAGRERDCRKAVKDFGFATYQPQLREQTVKRGRKIWAERLLFGRYFFAKWADGCDWRGLNGIRTVSGVFMRVDAELPALVRDAEIERIRASEVGGFVAGDLRAHFKKGQRVWASAGVFAGFKGEYLKSRGDIDIALLEMFGQQTRVEFAPGVLQAA